MEPRPELAGAGAVARRPVSRRARRDLAPDEDAAEVARQVCLDQLSWSARIRAELATALDARGVPPDVAVQVLDRFTEVGLVDDAAFARAWVARRSAAKALSARAIAQELRRRGVDEATSATALAGLDPVAEVGAARALVHRRLRGTAGLPPDARVRRLVGELGRKGHAPGLAFRVVREALAAEGLDLDGAHPADDT